MMRVDDVLNSIDVSSGFRKILKDKIMTFLSAKDCTGLTVDDGFGSYSFIFTRQNQYVRTTDEFEFLSDLENPRRVFRECYTSHNYDGLIKDSRFNAMIKRTGMEFVRCAGGYETDYSMADDVFALKDEINVRVYLNDGLKERSYELDLEKMELK